MDKEDNDIFRYLFVFAVGVVLRLLYFLGALNVGMMYINFVSASYTGAQLAFIVVTTMPWLAFVSYVGSQQLKFMWLQKLDPTEIPKM